MAVTNTLLDAISAPAQTVKNPLEMLEEAPFAGTDAAGFAELMRIVAPTPAPDGKVAPELLELQTGNELPERFFGASARPDSDATLEEFAVEMGIERDLARLLLTGTVKEEVVAPVEPRWSKPESSDAQIAVPADTPPPWFIAATADAQAMAIVGQADGATPQGERLVRADRPLINQPLTQPLADEDLLLWRASVGRMDSSTGTFAGPAAGTADRIVASAEAGTTTDGVRSIRELLWRRGPMESAVEAMLPIDEPLQRAAGERVLTSSPVVESLAATSGAVVGLAPSIAPSVTTDSIALPIGLSASAAIPTVAVSAESANQQSAFTGQGLLTSRPDVVQVLSAPDPNLSFGERVQAFAEAVAQRVLGQIRDEKWSVSLQLDPANLGAMEIDLTLRGNSVAANVGVASAEVRALLEAGLPRLKESLEASGLQLANWSFGQSGSRGFGESIKAPFAWSLRSAADGVESSVETHHLDMTRRHERSSSAVDLFV